MYLIGAAQAAVALVMTGIGASLFGRELLGKGLKVPAAAAHSH